MDQYEYMILKACECYTNSDLINSEELSVFIESIYMIKMYLENKERENSNSNGEIKC